MVPCIFEGLLYSILPIRRRVDGIEDEEVEDEQKHRNTGDNYETKEDCARHTVDMRNRWTIRLLRGIKPLEDGMNARCCDQLEHGKRDD